MSTANTLATAIQKFENNSLTNNPGSLVYSSWESQYGGYQDPATGFAAFPTSEQGFAALEARVSQLIGQGNSIQGIVNTWAGTQYGNSQASVDNYTSYLSSALGGASASAPVSSLPGYQPETGGATDWMSVLEGVAQGQMSANPAASAVNAPAVAAGVQQALSGSLFERVAVGAVGLACIVGGLFLSKTGQQIIVTGKSVATKAAALA